VLYFVEIQSLVQDLCRAQADMLLAKPVQIVVALLHCIVTTVYDDTDTQVLVVLAEAGPLHLDWLTATSNYAQAREVDDVTGMPVRASVVKADQT
jgi:hypothetical protein